MNGYLVILTTQTDDLPVYLSAEERDAQRWAYDFAQDSNRIAGAFAWMEREPSPLVAVSIVWFLNGSPTDHYTVLTF